MHRRLSELRTGETAVVFSVKAESPLRQRLLEMGFTPGAPVLVERFAPLNDPAEYKVLGYHVSLRRREADKIIVEQ